MHDGRLKNLEEVIDHYNHINNKNPNLDPNLSKHGTKGLQLTKEDKSALIAFLKTLTDPKFQKRSSVKNNSPKP
jgi:cytochrome c peroxidase